MIFQVNISLHIDPPLAHTVNIEPLTATDWESKSCLCHGRIDEDGQRLTLICDSY
jgi:hypothetical protein